MSDEDSDTEDLLNGTPSEKIVAREIIQHLQAEIDRLRAEVEEHIIANGNFNKQLSIAAETIGKLTAEVAAAEERGYKLLCNDNYAKMEDEKKPGSMS